MLKIYFEAENTADLHAQIEEHMNFVRGGASGSPAPAPAAAGKKATGTGAAGKAKAITLDQVREALGPVGTPAQKKDLIAKFPGIVEGKVTDSATKMSELRPEDYQGVLDAIAELKSQLEALD